jgi:hypothetical protein
VSRFETRTLATVQTTTCFGPTCEIASRTEMMLPATGLGGAWGTNSGYTAPVKGNSRSPDRTSRFERVITAVAGSPARSKTASATYKAS